METVDDLFGDDTGQLFRQHVEDYHNPFSRRIPFSTGIHGIPWLGGIPKPKLQFPA